MKLTGKLKDKVDKTESMVEKKDIIAEAGMELTDDELDMVTGGCDNSTLQAELERERRRAEDQLREIINEEARKRREEYQKRIEEELHNNFRLPEEHKLTPPLPPRF